MEKERQRKRTKEREKTNNRGRGAAVRDISSSNADLFGKTSALSPKPAAANSVEELELCSQ